MVTVSHGQEGIVWFGEDPLNRDTVTVTFGAKGFDALFDAGGRIFLKGCLIGRTEQPGSNSDGRELLKSFARVFLSTGGGRASASNARASINFFGSRMFATGGSVIHALVNRGGARMRITVGVEMAEPSGEWYVRANNQAYFYEFSRNNTVEWEEVKVFSPKSGKGTWQKTHVLRIEWESGSREEWDLPLFEEDTGILKTAGGVSYEVIARWSPHRRMID